MLDTDTKRRIDTARDILVGKVPDPKSQVEQINIALIYKFMDDMDAEAEELGGKRNFFAGDFARYGWAKLMRSGLGGNETLNLYAEAITKMPENPGIPPLFRNILKNAYLPYRDPETLRAFLKIIDEFTYDHSERLGDAFEYLLSVLGSQGDVGQFRTPRHIIDFIVEIIDPKKDDTILDPACGTAGFLISSYKHILRANTDDKGNSTLTPDDKGRLAKNFKGYDISPDMVRLSLVNLYLHGFTDPHIDEYDTLTSEDKWNEFADVILANPPFMSPKGGIKPHKRFSVQSKRSEVLFVDYMAEHLNPTGRAGIIVPEGIIFQSQTAYKELRKMLVENYLVAVVSLPAGVFNPYSGVKTSILILDKSLAKQSATIAFFKVENDGFGLGAQRREIEKNDLPQVNAGIAEYLRRLRARESVEDFEPTLGLIVRKEKVAAKGEYNLSGERYREVEARKSVYPHVRIGQLALVKNGFAFKSSEYTDRGLRVIRITNVQKGRVIDDNPKFVDASRAEEFSDYRLVAGDILMSLTGNVGRVGILEQCHEPALLNQRVAKIASVSEGRFLAKYLFMVLNTDNFEKDAIASAAGLAQPNLSSQWVADYEIPLPPLEVQKEIVAEIEDYQKVIDGARAVLDYYHPHIPIHPDWPMVRLADICETISDGDHQPPPKASEGVPFVTIGNIGEDHELDFTKTFFVPESYYASLSVSRKPQKGDVLYSVTGSYGIPVMVRSDRRFCFQRHIALIRTGLQLNNGFLHCLLSSPFMLQQADQAATGVAQKTVSLNSLRNFQIPLPPLETQKQIVAEIEAEQALIAANRELIERFEKKIQATLARVWGEDEPTPVEA